MEESRQNSTHQMGEAQQVSYRRPKNIWCQCRKLSCLGDLAPKICAPLGYG